MSKRLQFVILFQLAAIFFCGLALAISTEMDAYNAVVNVLKSKTYSEAEINAALPLIDEYQGKYTEGTFVDDLSLLKAVLLNRKLKFAESNYELTLLLKSHPYPVIEKSTLTAFPILPNQWLQLDVLTFINSLRAENYKGLNDNTQASAAYQSVIDHLNKEPLFKTAYKDKYFEFYANVVEIYLKEKNVIKAKRFANEYIRDENNLDIQGKERMKVLLGSIQDNFISKRDPFSRPMILEPVVPSVNVTASSNADINALLVNKVTLAGIITDVEKTVILNYKDKSFVKKQGDYFRGYRISRIGSNWVTFSNGVKSKTLKLGEGSIL